MKNVKNPENRKSKSIAHASKGKRVTKLNKKENIKNIVKTNFLMRILLALHVTFLLMILRKKIQNFITLQQPI